MNIPAFNRETLNVIFIYQGEEIMRLEDYCEKLPEIGNVFTMFDNGFFTEFINLDNSEYSKENMVVTSIGWSPDYIDEVVSKDDGIDNFDVIVRLEKEYSV